jgi:hypothetical protein
MWEYMFVVISLSSALTFSAHALNYLRLPLSFFPCLTCSFNSLILTSLSLFFLTRSLRFCSIANVKVVLVDTIEIKSFLTSSVTGVSMTTDKGLPPLTKSFLIYCCTILLVALSNHNFFIFSTLQGL